MSILGVLSLLGMIENAVVIVTVLRRLRLESWTYILVCHLAFCDLLTCVIAAPLWITGHIGRNFIVCRASISATCVPMLGSSWTLVLIAYERYIYIKYPLRHTLIITTKKITFAICLIWVVSLVASSLIMTVAFRRPKDDHCFVPLMINRWLIGIMVPIVTVMPVTLMFTAYTYILRKALQQQRRSVVFEGIDDRRARAQRLPKERRTIRMLYSIVFAYITCVLPYAAVGLVDSINPNTMTIDMRSKIDNLSIFLFANAVVNPVLYAMMNKDIRREILCRRNIVVGSSAVW